MREQSKSFDATNRVTTALFIIYLLVLCWILLLKLGVHFSYMEKRIVNLVPFTETRIITAENILNLVIFIPLGIYAGSLFQRWFFSKKLFFFFLCSLLIEGLQYILRIGAFDVTDIITNTLG
jgi:glycopeptide antibiotics resistance protein